MNHSGILAVIVLSVLLVCTSAAEQFCGLGGGTIAPSSTVYQYSDEGCSINASIIFDMFTDPVTANVTMPIDVSVSLTNSFVINGSLLGFLLPSPSAYLFAAPIYINVSNNTFEIDSTIAFYESLPPNSSIVISNNQFLGVTALRTETPDGRAGVFLAAILWDFLASMTMFNYVNDAQKVFIGSDSVVSITSNLINFTLTSVAGGSNDAARAIGAAASLAIGDRSAFAIHHNKVTVAAPDVELCHTMGQCEAFAVCFNFSAASNSTDGEGRIVEIHHNHFDSILSSPIHLHVDGAEGRIYTSISMNNITGTAIAEGHAMHVMAMGQMATVAIRGNHFQTALTAGLVSDTDTETETETETSGDVTTTETASGDNATTTEVATTSPGNSTTGVNDTTGDTSSTATATTDFTTITTATTTATTAPVVNATTHPWFVMVRLMGASSGEFHSNHFEGSGLFSVDGTFVHGSEYIIADNKFAATPEAKQPTSLFTVNARCNAIAVNVTAPTANSSLSDSQNCSVVLSGNNYTSSSAVPTTVKFISVSQEEDPSAAKTLLTVCNNTFADSELRTVEQIIQYSSGLTADLLADLSVCRYSDIVTTTSTVANSSTTTTMEAPTTTEGNATTGDGHETSTSPSESTTTAETHANETTTETGLSTETETETSSHNSTTTNEPVTETSAEVPTGNTTNTTVTAEPTTNSTTTSTRSTTTPTTTTSTTVTTTTVAAPSAAFVLVSNDGNETTVLARLQSFYNLSATEVYFLRSATSQDLSSLASDNGYNSTTYDSSKAFVIAFSASAFARQASDSLQKLIDVKSSTLANTLQISGAAATATVVTSAPSNSGDDDDDNKVGIIVGVVVGVVALIVIIIGVACYCKSARRTKDNSYNSYDEGPGVVPLRDLAHNQV